jgi:hypothetical protein
MRRDKSRLLILSALLVFSAVSTIYACGEAAERYEQVDVTRSGLDQILITSGDDLPDFLEDVEAKDPDGNTLEVKIDEEKTDKIDNVTPGRYSIYYVAYNGTLAIDSDHNGIAKRNLVIERGSYIDNQTFDEGILGWKNSVNGDSMCNLEWDKEQKAVRVNVTNSSNEYRKNQLEYNGLSVKQNTTYVVNFKAKSTTKRNVGASLEVPDYDYKLIEDVSNNALGLKTSDKYQEFNFYFTASANYSSVKLALFFGRFNEDDDAESTVWIDDISVKPLAKTANTSGVTFSNGHNYVVIGDYEQYAALPDVIAKDADGNDLQLTKLGAVPSSFGDYSRLLFGEARFYEDDEGNLSYFKREIDFTKGAEGPLNYDQ